MIELYDIMGLITMELLVLLGGLLLAWRIKETKK